jgi:hypothetical protein
MRVGYLKGRLMRQGNGRRPQAGGRFAAPFMRTSQAVFGSGAGQSTENSRDKGPKA